MPDQTKVVVTNTTPLIALTAATGSLEVLRVIYAAVVVPFEVAQEIKAGGKESFGLDIFQQSAWLTINDTPVVLPPYLQNALDLGEAAVIQTALQMGIQRVCIDETIGRRVARLSNLDVRGTIGILLKAKSLGYPVSMPDAVKRMHERGIWLSKEVISFALAH
jgi:predicted nucleic acid-binding protein